MLSEIFVYGTLMPSAGGELGAQMRSRLAEVSRTLGPASVQGKLFDLGEYPAMAQSSDPHDRVHGVLLTLQDPAGTLPWLDRYEGVGRGPAAAGEYDRLMVPVLLSDDTVRDAWIYLFTRPVRDLPQIVDGRWRR